MSEQQLSPEDQALVAGFARTGAELLQGIGGGRHIPAPQTVQQTYRRQYHE